jgi:hypothetical protein
VEIFFCYLLYGKKIVCIATGYGLDDLGVGVRVLVEQEFPLLHVVQTDSEDHPASYSIGTGVKRPGCEADNLQLVPRSRKRESIRSIPPYVFIAQCLISYAQGQLFCLLCATASTSLCNVKWQNDR